MRIIYNGVDLMPLETHSCEFDPIYSDDGVDYLFTRVSISVRALVTGDAFFVTPGSTSQNGPFISYDFLENIVGPNGADGQRTPPSTGPDFLAGTTNVPVPNPTQGIGRSFDPAFELRTIQRVVVTPIRSVAAIRHRLLTPRGTLHIFAGAGMESGVPRAGSQDTPDPNPGTPLELSLLLSSPQLVRNVGTERMRTDVKNGPIPKLLGIVEAFGDAKTLVVDWACETYIIEASLNNIRPVGNILSNRFRQSHIVDKDGYTTISTEGSAIYRTDLVYNTDTNPDVDRAFIFLPIPQGFVRENISVTGREDVTGVDYSFQDRQQPVNYVAGPFVKSSSISALHRQAVVSNTDILTGVMGVVEGVIGIKAQRNFAKSDPKDPQPQPVFIVPPPAVPGGGGGARAKKRRKGKRP